MTRSGPYALAVALALMSSCPGVYRPLEHPRASVVAVAADIDRDGVLVRMRINAFNPNAVDMRAKVVDWQLSIGDSTAVRGRVAIDEVVPAKGQATVDAAWRIVDIAANDIAARVNSGRAEYRVSGTVHLFGKQGALAALFRAQGTLVGSRRLPVRFDESDRPLPEVESESSK